MKIIKFKAGSSQRHWFEIFAAALTRFSGSTTAFVIATAIILVWGIMGPLFDYSDRWLSVITTVGTLVTFLMVFLIQRAQNKESLALQLKLNEIIAVTSGASNTLVDVENSSEKELKELKIYYGNLTNSDENDIDLKQSLTSVEDGEEKDSKSDEINLKNYEKQ